MTTDLTISSGGVVQDRLALWNGDLADDGHAVVLRRLASDRSASGVPGPTGPAGTPVGSTGTDVLRVADAEAAECRVDADMHVLVGRLGHPARRPATPRHPHVRPHREGAPR